MAKTNSTGGKGGGYEHWSRRANGGGKWHNQSGRDDKTLTHRQERRSGKRETNRAAELGR